MNILKYYRRDGNQIKVARVRIPRCNSYDKNAGHIGIARADEQMVRAGWTRRRPREFRQRPPAQQTGYRQPTQQALRRARQLLRKKRSTTERTSP